MLTTFFTSPSAWGLIKGYDVVVGVDGEVIVENIKDCRVVVLVLTDVGLGVGGFVKGLLVVVLRVVVVLVVVDVVVVVVVDVVVIVVGVVVVVEEVVVVV